MEYLRPTYTKKLFIIYVKFKFNWESCVLPGNPNYFKLPGFYCTSIG